MVIDYGTRKVLSVCLSRHLLRLKIKAMKSCSLMCAVNTLMKC